MYVSMHACMFYFCFLLRVLPSAAGQIKIRLKGAKLHGAYSGAEYGLLQRNPDFHKIVCAWKCSPPPRPKSEESKGRYRTGGERKNVFVDVRHAQRCVWGTCSGFSIFDCRNKSFRYVSMRPCVVFGCGSRGVPPSAVPPCSRKVSFWRVFSSLRRKKAGPRKTGPGSQRFPRILRNLWGSGGRFRRTFHLAKSFLKRGSVAPKGSAEIWVPSPAFHDWANSSPRVDLYS